MTWKCVASNEPPLFWITFNIEAALSEDPPIPVIKIFFKLPGAIWYADANVACVAVFEISFEPWTLYIILTF